MTDSIKSDVSQMRQTDIDFPRNDDVYFDLDNNTEPSAYTTDEIDEARQAESLIVKGFMLYNRIGFRSAERIYEFRERELYHRLGYKSFHEWLKFSDLLRSTVSPYLHAYIDLTVAREIPVAEYEKIDVGIIRLLRPLLKAGATNSEVRDAFQDSREMIPIDFKALIDEKVKKIEARSNTEGEISSKADE